MSIEEGGASKQWETVAVLVGRIIACGITGKARNHLRQGSESGTGGQKIFLTAGLTPCGASPPLCESSASDTYDDHYAYGDRTVALALKYASGAVQDHILSVLSPEEREALEIEMDACLLVRQTDVERAQREILGKVASYRQRS